MDTQRKDIKYDYYPIECINLQHYKRDIMCTFQGRVNQPNIVHYDDNNIVINYQATDLYIYGNLHNKKNVDGEIVILHSPTTSEVKLYCCFPFAYKKMKKDTVFDVMISSKTSSVSQTYQDPPLSLCLNEYIPLSPVVNEYYTTDKFGDRCKVIVFDNIIFINHRVEKLNNDLFEASFLYSDSSSIILEDKLRSPSLLVKEGDNNFPVIEGMSDDVYSCEYLPVDSEDMVQVLQVPIGSPGYNNLVGDQVSNVFLNNAIFMFFVIFVFIISPLAHNFLESMVIDSYRKLFICTIAPIYNTLKIKVNLLDIILVLVIFIVSVILLICGISYSNSTATSIGIFLPFCGFVGYLGIKYVNTISGKDNEEPKFCEN